MFCNGKALVGNGMVLVGEVNGRRGIIRKTDFSQELLPGPSAPNFGITRVSARTFPENGFFRKTEWEKAVDTPPKLRLSINFVRSDIKSLVNGKFPG